MGRFTNSRRPWYALVILFVVLAMVGSACGDDDDAAETTTTAGGDTTQATDATTTEPMVEGRSLTMALPEWPRHLASWNGYSNDGHPIIRNTHEALLNRNPDTNELIPELATSYEQLDDFTWRFTLREGVMFHDGTMLNAEDAAFVIEMQLDPDTAYPIRQFFGAEVDAEAVDEYTLDITTTTADGEPVADPILPLRMYFLPIPSRAAYEADPGAYETNPVGTGPYKLVEWSQGQYIDLTAFEDWWGRRDTADAFGTNEVVTDVRYIVREESAVRSALLDTDEADFARFITPEQCQAAPQCFQTPTTETIIVRIDIQNPTLSDLRVRQAIAYAIDKDAIMNDIQGGGEVANQIVSSTALGWNASLEPYPFDLDAARALVEEARADGVDVEAEFTFAARTGFILRADEIIEFIVTNLRDIGLTGASAQMMETAAFEDLWQPGGYDVVSPDRAFVGMNQHGNELMDYAASMGYYTCDGTPSNLCDPTLEAMIAEAQALSGDARDAALQEVAAYVHDLYYIIPVGYPSFNFGLVDGIDWEPRMDGFILIKEFQFS